MFLRWLMNTKMEEFYDQLELGLNHFFEKGLMVHYVYWDSQELKQQQTIRLDEIAQALPAIAEAIQDGSMDEELSSALKDQFKVSKTKAKAMLRELRNDSTTTIPVTRRVVNRPRIKALAPDEDVLWPNYTIDPQEAPYVFHVLRKGGILSLLKKLKNYRDIHRQIIIYTMSGRKTQSYGMMMRQSGYYIVIRDFWTKTG